MANRTPYNIEFCRFKECPNLKVNKKCKLAECPYNHKRVIFWGKFGVWKGD